MNKAQADRKPPIVFAEQCDRGLVREENQDSVLHARIALGELLIVADGIGGYQGGATASRMVVEGFHGYLATLPPDYPVDRAICEASAQVNARIIEAANLPDSPYRRMGSTVVLALLQQNAAGTNARIGHIGDSRAYLMRGGQLTRITSDHSAVQALLNRNLITPEQALTHPDASVLTRSLGHKPQVEIELENVPLLPGDTLLLCSDGLWGYVAEEEIQRIAADAGLTAEAASQALLELALAAGGHDNIGIELARLNIPSAVAPAPSKLPLRKGFMELFALCLIAVAALGALGYSAVRAPWFKSLLHSNRQAQRAQTDAANQESPLTFAVVLGPGADDSNLYPVPGWNRAELAADKQYECRELAGKAKVITAFYKELPPVGRFVESNRSFFKDLTVSGTRERDLEIQTKCGDYNLVVLVPGVKPAVVSKPEVKPQQPVKPAAETQPKPPVQPGPQVQPKPADQAQPPATLPKPMANTPGPAANQPKPQPNPPNGSNSPPGTRPENPPK